MAWPYKTPPQHSSSRNRGECSTGGGKGARSRLPARRRRAGISSHCSSSSIPSSAPMIKSGTGTCCCTSVRKRITQRQKIRANSRTWTLPYTERQQTTLARTKTRQRWSQDKIGAKAEARTSGARRPRLALGAADGAREREPAIPKA